MSFQRIFVARTEFDAIIDQYIQELTSQKELSYLSLKNVKVSKHYLCSFDDEMTRCYSNTPQSQESANIRQKTRYWVSYCEEFFIYGLDALTIHYVLGQK